MLVNADGNRVEFKVTDKDIITFDTMAGNTYIISGLSRCEYISAPVGLSISECKGSIVLTWTPTSGACKYNVYIARDSDSGYTLIGSSNGTSYTYSNKKKYTRLTFAVTALSGAGNESKRALVYKNQD